MVSTVSCIFRAPLKPWQIQFKCKATEEEVFLFAISSTSASASFGQYRKGPSPHVQCSMNPTDQSIASDQLLDTLDLYLIRMDHPFALVLPLDLSAYFSSAVIKHRPQRKYVPFFFGLIFCFNCFSAYSMRSAFALLLPGKTIT